MKAYSIDLRERAVTACDAGESSREVIAAQFSVRVSWIRDLLRRRHETGSLAPRPRGGGLVCSPSVVHRMLKRLGIMRK